MPNNAATVTVTVHLDMDINGEPVSVMYSEPATVESLRQNANGIVVHLHLDAAKLANVLAPYLSRTERAVSGSRGDEPSRE